MITNLHHVAILTSNIDEAVEYYANMLGCLVPGITQVEKPGAKFQTAMLPVGQSGTTSLQLIEPSEGPGVKELAEGGEGTLFEIAFQVDSTEEFAEQMIAKGITPCDIAENSIKEKYITSKFGNKYFVLPASKMRGTRIEIVQMV